jgi:hypothetical protein
VYDRADLDRPGVKVYTYFQLAVHGGVSAAFQFTRIKFDQPSLMSFRVSVYIYMSYYLKFSPTHLLSYVQYIYPHIILKTKGK